MSWRRGQAYAQDLRERVRAATDLTLRQAAARLSVSPSFVAKARARLRDTGHVTPGLQRNLVPPRLLPLHDALRAWVAAEHGVRVSHPVMWKALARMGLTLKKGGCGRPSRTGPTLPSDAPPGPR